jgi:hypothetical protein
MVCYSKIASSIDDVADKIQALGLMKEAEYLDAISNTLDEMEVEASFRSKLIGGLFLLQGLLGLTSAQAQDLKEGEIPVLNEKQITVLEKSDPKKADDYKNYLSVQNTRLQEHALDQGRLPNYTEDQIRGMDRKTRRWYKKMLKKKQTETRRRQRERSRELPGGPVMMA